MTAVIRIKRSSVAGSVPTLLDGELAINQKDKKLFCKDSTGSIKYLDFTSDDEKVASGAIKTALDTKASINNPDFKGDNPTINSNTIFHLGNATLSSRAINFREKKFLLSDYGAVSNDMSTIATAANKAAFNNVMTNLNNSPRGGVIVVPNDDVYLSSLIQANPVVATCIIEGSSYCSRLVYNNTTDGYLLALQGSDVSNVGLNNLKIISYNAQNLVTIAQLRGGRGKRPIICDNVAIEGGTSARPSSSFLTLINPNNCIFSNINIEAGSVGSYGSTGTGIIVQGDGQNTDGAIAVDFKFDAAMISRVNTGIKLIASSTSKHTLEGAMFNDCILVGVQVGLDWGSPGDLTPGMSWRGGHINASKYGMVLSNIAQFKISDTLIYMDVYNNPIAAVQIQNGCKDVSIHNNTFWMVDTQQTNINAAMNAVIVTGNSVDTDIVFNKFYMKTTDPYLRIDSGCQYTRHGFNEKVTGGGLDVSNAGSNSIYLGGSSIR